MVKGEENEVVGQLAIKQRFQKVTIDSETRPAPETCASGSVRGSFHRFLSEERFSRVSHLLILMYCMCAALSIAAAQSLLALVIVYWLAIRASSAESSDATSSDLSPAVLAAPMAVWFGVGILTSFTGIDPLRSVVEALKSSLFLLLPFAIYSSCTASTLPTRQFLGRLEAYVTALILGQCIAAVHTICSEVAGYELPLSIPGSLTESGQLVLVIPLLLAGTFYTFATLGPKDDLCFTVLGRRVQPQVFGSLIFACLLIVAWPGAILFDESAMGTLITRLAALVAALALAIPALRRGAPLIKEKFGGQSGLPIELSQLIWPAAGLLFAAFLINLKRGPWMGVFVELIVLGFLLSRRLLFWSVVLSFFIVLTLSPARTRVANMNEHFSISGGRKEMWELGAEIAQRYPMGLGTNNARYMRELDPEIPQTHRHMHNNLLNVLVETGWIGLAAYMWWMATAIAYGLRLWRDSRTAKDRVSKQLGVFALCLSVALVGWQVSGLVEYNFGDGEVRLIAFVFMGLLLSIGRFLSTNGFRPEKTAS